jgi:hypothetical protein
MRALSATMTLWDVPDGPQVRTQCKTSCDEDFVIARDLCRNIDPVTCTATPKPTVTLTPVVPR